MIRLLKQLLQDQKGYGTFALALIGILVVSFIVVPFLGLLPTHLIATEKSAASVTTLSSGSGGVEHALWRLAYEAGFADSLDSQNPTTSYNLNINNTDVTVTVTKVLPPDQVSSDLKLRVTKSVTPTTATPGVPETFTYTIQIENEKENSEQVNDLRDTLPPGFSYVLGSSSGITSSDPTINPNPNGDLLKWAFNPQITFQPGEIKTQSFQATATSSEGVHCNNVRITPTNSQTGPTAKIIVGNPPSTGCPGASLELTKTVTPTTANLLETTTFTYTISIENTGAVSLALQEIRDVLPWGGFTYVSGFSSGVTTSDPTETLLADGRWELTWNISPGLTTNPGETKTQTFQSRATLESDTHCNEVWVTTPETSPPETYSWPTACVTVPASKFDVESITGGVTVRVNTIISGSTSMVRSWQIE